ncbi:TPA: hypothetical protein JXW31_003149, partial [Enterococcus faecium]|nr:hypothetical protein [Enterococcus faecium]
TYGTNQSDKARLWMGVPKKIFLEYARENEDKKLAEQMIKENRYGTTVFYEKDRSIKRWLLMKYMFHNYIPRFKKYFHVKEG